MVIVNVCASMLLPVELILVNVIDLSAWDIMQVGFVESLSPVTLAQLDDVVTMSTVSGKTIFICPDDVKGSRVVKENVYDVY